MASSFIPRLVLLAGAVAAPVLAHGGQYRAPGLPGLVPGGPSTGGPMGPGTPGPRTGSLGSTGADTSWSVWWEYNKDPFLRLREAVHDPGGIAPGDTVGQTGTRPRSLAPTDETRREVILPALFALCERETNRDVQTACMVAIAKIRVDHPELDMLQLFRERLARGDQEIRETAALCLGLSRRTAALGDLVALARDVPDGRRLVGSASVDRRTRAFATFGLGLLAEQNPELELQQQIAGVLTEQLAVDDREIRVAAIQSFGLLQLEDGAGQKRLRWKLLERLWEFWQRDIGRGDEVVQAHVPKTVARLLGRGTGAEHARAKRLLADELDARERRGPAIRQSAALALGALVLPEEQHAADGEHSALLREHAKDGKDELARYFALIALGQIGGEANREYLLRALRDGGKATVKPWAALALGLLAWDERHRAGGAVDTTIGRVLHREVEDTKNDEFRGAAAVALGLTGYTEAVRELLQVLSKSRLREALRGYVTIGFALMDAQETVPIVQAQVADAEHMPLLLMQAATALGVLRDKDAVNLLTAMLREKGASVARLAGIATAFRFIGDRRNVDGLVTLLADRELTKLGHAFVAAALGGVADDDPLPWNASFAIGTNYRAPTETLVGAGSGILDIL